MYGIPDAPRFPYRLPGHNMIEYPISTALLLGRSIPVGGGGYFRLFSYWFTKMTLSSINAKENKPFLFFLHPWKIIPGQPRFAKACWKSRFRHYNNLYKTGARLERFLRDFSFGIITGNNLQHVG